MRSISCFLSRSIVFAITSVGLLVVAPTITPAYAQTVNSFDRGNYTSDGFSSSTITNYFAGIGSGSASLLTRNFFAFNIPTLLAGQQYVSATFRFNTFGINTGDNSETLALRDYTGSIAALTAGSAAGSSGISIYNDLGDGSNYGSITLTPSQSNQFVTVTLSSAALANINTAAGGQFAFGGFVSTTDATRRTEFIAGNSDGTGASDGNTQLLLTVGSSSAPEPSSLLLFVPALGIFTVARRRKHALKPAEFISKTKADIAGRKTDSQG